MSEPGKSQGGGNLKYVLGGIALLAGAVAVMLSLKSPEPARSRTREGVDMDRAQAPDRAHETGEPAPATAPRPQNAERVNPMAQPDLILDEPGEPPANAPDTAVATTEKPKTAAARGDWDCDGDLSVSALQVVIDGNRAQVRNCYERRLRVNNALQGDLKVKLKVASTGQISATAITGTLKDNEVIGCVRTLAQHWSFPAPTGGACAVVQIPFQFSPKL